MSNINTNITLLNSNGATQTIKFPSLEYLKSEIDRVNININLIKHTKG